MMYAKYALLLVVNLAIGLVNIVFAPLIVLAANDEGWLPQWLWWFQTPDNSLDADYSGKRFPGKQVGLNRWYSRFMWCYRNPCYGFAISVLGAQAQPGDVLITSGDPKTDNHKPIHTGWVRYTLLRNGKPIYFQLYLVKPWLFGLYFRGNFGWKLWGYPTTEKMQFTFSPNPFRKIS